MTEFTKKTMRNYFVDALDKAIITGAQPHTCEGLNWELLQTISNCANEWPDVKDETVAAAYKMFELSLNRDVKAELDELEKGYRARLVRAGVAVRPVG